MASRAEHKQQARARRIAEDQARSEHKRRQRRVFILGGVALAAVLVVAVAIAASGLGGSTTLKKGSAQTTLVAQVQQMLNGIPQSGPTLGSPRAPVTMTYYSDLQCPVCAEFTLASGFPELVAKDVRAGRVKVVYRAVQTATRDPHTFQNQQIAALAAGRQNHFWDYVELFYRQQGTEGTGYVTEKYLNGLAQQVSQLDLTAWRSARNDASLTGELQSDQQSAATARIQGTPTLIFHGPRGTAQAPQSVPSYEALQQVISSVR